ncbi:hypothetical protein VFPBJ_09694 [Purpureocillium lilacinum]|uniref:Uncharacterized protein n=1 Tax=Purpureocillium lilacinum TaxID=33203 RepID=A0A179GEA8_PURLI|nr:hypothetical protein VFPBJ_09694 [Purpureocillium lilacinum]
MPPCLKTSRSKRLIATVITPLLLWYDNRCWIGTLPAEPGNGAFSIASQAPGTATLASVGKRSQRHGDDSHETMPCKLATRDRARKRSLLHLRCKCLEISLSPRPGRCTPAASGRQPPGQNQPV